MISIRIHGRGGQGAVTAAELLAISAFHQGKSAQAFPFFGVERRGAPVESYCRISDKKITARNQIAEPDYLIIQDANLVKESETLKGIKPETVIIINSEKPADKFKLPLKIKIKTISATKIALDTLGKPIINTALLGAFIASTDIIDFSSLKRAIKEKFAEKDKNIIEKNIQAATTAYQQIKNNI